VPTGGCADLRAGRAPHGLAGQVVQLLRGV